MTRTFRLLLSFIFLSLSFLPANTAKLVLIDKVEFRDQSLVLKHNSLGDISFKKRIYSNPPRLVFDVLNADLVGSKKAYAVTNSDITDIRVGQFEPTVVRVVIQSKTTSALEKVKIDNIGQNIYFKFDINNVLVKDIKFDRGDILVDASGHINFRRIELEKPERLVIDLIGARLKNKNLKQVFQNGNEEIRTAQFDKSTVRIVFSGPKTHKRKTVLSDDEKALVIEGKDQRKKTIKLKDKLLSLQLFERNKQESIFLIKSTKKLDYKFLKLHKPERLVVDLYGIAFEESLRANQFSETKHVKDVRFGIATSSAAITRIVFDLKDTGFLEEFSLSREGTELRVKIAGEPSADPKLPKAYKSVGKKVVIDPGHGGYDPGAMYGGYNEKDITLAISQKVKKYLQKAGIKAYLTRYDDRFISLAERVEISNSISPAIFVSVHVNALATNTKMDGLQTYYYSSAGYKIASVIHSQLLEDVKMTNRNIRRARFWVTKYTRAPSILSELGFMTNVKERKKLASSSYQDKLAESLARGIIKYLEKNSK